MIRPAPRFYILHGDNAFDLRAELRSMRAKVASSEVGDLNITVFEGKTTSASEVIATAQMLPFLAKQRLVIVENMLTWLGRPKAGESAKAELKSLEKHLPSLPESARLVFAEFEPLKESHPLLKLAKDNPHALVKSYAPPRDPLDRDGKRWDQAWVTKWIMHHAERLGGQIDQRAAFLLAGLIEQDLYAADAELTKLILYADQRPITEEDVAAMTQYVSEANIFEIVDAMGKGDARKALHLIHRMLYHFKESPLGILAMINRQFRLLIMVREVLDNNGGRPELRALPDFSRLPDKVLGGQIDQARRFSMADLERFYLHLLETDYRIKTGAISDELALDLLAASLAK